MYENTQHMHVCSGTHSICIYAVEHTAHVCMNPHQTGSLCNKLNYHSQAVDERPEDDDQEPVSGRERQERSCNSSREFVTTPL